MIKFMITSDARAAAGRARGFEIDIEALSSSLELALISAMIR